MRSVSSSTEVIRENRDISDCNATPRRFNVTESIFIVKFNYKLINDIHMRAFIMKLLRICVIMSLKLFIFSIKIFVYLTTN